MDPDANWMLDDDSSVPVADGVVDVATEGTATDQVEDWLASSVTAGPPVPNPYAHVLDVPCKKREFMHWARNKHLQYKYLHEYAEVYYNDYIDYMDKRRLGVKRDVPRPQEWAERSLKLYAKEPRMSANDVAYWFTTKNQVKPKCNIIHSVHSKRYYDQQYKNIMC